MRRMRNAIPRLHSSAWAGLLVAAFVSGAGRVEASTDDAVSPLEGAVCPAGDVPDSREASLGSMDSSVDSGDGFRSVVPSTGVTPESDLRFARWFAIPVDRSSVWKTFTVRAGDVGVTLHATTRDPAFTVSIEVKGPNGTFLSCHRCEDSPVVGEEKRGRGSAQIPSTDRPGAALVPGEYQFRVNALPLASSSEQGDDRSTFADVLAAFRSNPSDDVDHRIDLNFVYLPGIPLTRKIAISSPEFDELLTLLAEDLSPLGIGVGDVTHVDLDRPEFTHLGSWDESARLFVSTSMQVGRPRALNVYCVGVFEGDFLNVAGLSGGIPGPAVNGTRDSGVALRIAPTFPNFLEAYAVLLAHEIGHYLGFYHTTEANLLHEDPLSDTPRCNEPDLHACPDWSYHMFPLVNVAMNTWSPSQIEIAKTHPLVRALPAPGMNRGGRASLPNVLAKVRAHPNPFSNDVVFTGPIGATASTLEVFDVAGRRLRSLGGQGATWMWDGRDERGRPAPPGIYFVRVGVPGEAEFISRIVRAP